MDKVSKDELRIKYLLSNRAAQPESNFKKDLLKKLFIKQDQLIKRRNVMSNINSKKTIGSKAGFALAGGAACLIAVVALVVFSLPQVQEDQSVSQSVDSSTNSSRQDTNDDVGIGRSEKFSSFKDAAKKLSFVPYAITKPLSNEVADELLVNFDESIHSIYSNYKKAGKPFYTVSQSNQLGESYDDGSQEVNITIEDQAVTAHFVAPQDVEKDGYKRTGGQLYWNYNGMSYSIVDESGEQEGITKTQFIQLAESLKPYNF